MTTGTLYFFDASISSGCARAQSGHSRSSKTINATFSPLGGRSASRSAANAAVEAASRKTATNLSVFMGKRVAIILSRLSRKSVMKPVPDLHHQLSRVIPVRSAEGVAVVKQVAAVGHVQRRQPDRPVLTKLLANCHIERSVRTQVCGAIAV